MSRILKEALDETNVKTVVIIMGNPDKMHGMEKLAETYYNAIAGWVKDEGFAVEFDPGEPMTCPNPNATFWIAHSRGVDRVRCIDKKDQWRFLKFGSLDGVIHPVDAKWQATIEDHVSTKELPPKEHFEFTSKQKQAIDMIIRKLR